MMLEEKQKLVLERFHECRKSFVASLNSITLLSSIILITTIIPYTSYVYNLLAVRSEKTDGQERLIPLNFREQNANFDLSTLQLEWLKKHDPSSVENGNSILSRNTQLKSPVGAFSFGSAELVLVYPAMLSLLMIYLFLHMYNLSTGQKL